MIELLILAIVLVSGYFVVKYYWPKWKAKLKRMVKK